LEDFGGVEGGDWGGVPGGELCWMFADDDDQVVVTLGMDLNVREQMEYVYETFEQPLVTVPGMIICLTPSQPLYLIIIF